MHDANSPHKRWGYVFTPQSAELQSHIEEMEHAVASLNQQLESAQSKLYSLKTSLEEQIQTLEVSLISRHAMLRYMQ